MRKLALLIAAPLLLAACAQSANAPSSGGKADYAGSAPAPAQDAASGYSGVASTTTNQGIPTVVVTADRNLILTAKIDMRSKDPWATSDRAQAIASGLGGDVLKLTPSGRRGTRRAGLPIPVPARPVADVLRTARTLGG